MADTDDLFAHIEDEPIPGGCPSCDAYQSLSEVEAGVWSLVIHHDDWCPFLRARESRMN